MSCYCLVVPNLLRNSSIPDEQILPTSPVAATGPEVGGVLHREEALPLDHLPGPAPQRPAKVYLSRVLQHHHGVHVGLHHPGSLALHCISLKYLGFQLYSSYFSVSKTFIN